MKSKKDKVKNRQRTRKQKYRNPIRSAAKFFGEDSTSSELSAKIKLGTHKEIRNSRDRCFYPNYNYIRKFLEKNVGRDWDNVYSDLLNGLTGYTKENIKKNLDYIVLFGCSEKNGQIYRSDGKSIVKHSIKT